jgi:hypothetical protein
MQQSMEPLFVQYRVNVVLSGHQHAYVRSHSLGPNARVDKTGTSPIYFTVGTGGQSHSLGPIHPHSNGSPNSSEGHPDAWVAARDHTTFGAGQLQLINATHAYWERLLIEDDEEEADDDDHDDNQQEQPRRHKVSKKSLRDPVWFVNPYHPKR